MTTHTILDAYCCAGLGADGYSAVGFEPTGWDLFDQPHYPYEFHQGDAIALLCSDIPERYTAIHTSPPCQLFTQAKHLREAQGSKSKETIDLLTPTIEILRTKWAHKPWVVENVEYRGTFLPPMAPRPGESLIRLCGSMFHLECQRHRWFLSNVPLRQPVAEGKGKHRSLGCRHERFPLDPITGKPRPWGIYHVKGDNVPSGGRTCRDEEHGREVMGSRRLLPWDSLKEGFPPAYASHVGVDLIRAIEAAKAAPADLRAA